MSKAVSRRSFVKAAASLPLAAAVTSYAPAAWAGAGAGGEKQAMAGEHLLFAGVDTNKNSNRGIYAYHFDSNAGELKPLGLAAETPNPTYLTLSPDRKLLFAANEVDSFAGAASGGVSAFRLAGEGRLTAINAQPSGGKGTCFVGVDPSGRTLLAANYTGGSAASFRIGADGALSPAVSEFHYSGQGPNKARQEAPHVHRAIASPSGKYAFFCDLGLDVIHVYALVAATGKLNPHTPAAWNAPAGSGPRALRFHPNGRWAYCVMEMGSAVALLHWDEEAGRLTTEQVVKLTPEGFAGRAQASEIVFDRAGRFAYAACRYYDVLVSFSVDPSSGMLTMLGRSACGGKVPRDITLDPTERWLLAANQDSDGVGIVARDAKTGRLGETAKVFAMVKPQCLVFV